MIQNCRYHCSRSSIHVFALKCISPILAVLVELFFGYPAVFEDVDYIPVSIATLDHTLFYMGAIYNFTEPTDFSYNFYYCMSSSFLEGSKCMYHSSEIPFFCY